MSEYLVTIRWLRGNAEPFTDNQYSRGHAWEFDGGSIIKASSSPTIVPLPYSVEANVDPEEAFVASLSSCHMLFFLSIAAKRGFIIDEYIDYAVGLMEKNAEGRTAITQVTLRPKVKFSGAKKPSKEQLEAMHHESHEKCFIANSVRTIVTTEIIDS